MAIHRPADAAGVAEIVAAAAADQRPLEIVGGGSKRGLGRPDRPDDQLDLSALSGVIDYDPAELVLVARPSTPLAVLDAMLSEQRQMLAFEPPDWRSLHGGAGTPTLGGAIACNQSGPRRVRAGAARDHFLGFAAVNGWGDPWKAGGRVVKNVTGYDMSKLQAGAFGTLSVLTELCVRVLPLPETSATVLVLGLDDAAALRAMADALNAPEEVSAAAHIPAPLAARSSVAAIAGRPTSVTALRLEGVPASVAFRAAQLRSRLHATDTLGSAHSNQLWREIGDARLLPAPAGRAIWRVCPTPSNAAEIAAAVGRAHAGTEWLYDWGGGLLWLSVPITGDAASTDGGAATVRAATARAGGHATLFAADDALRAHVPVFEPEAPPLAAATRRVKASFDPNGVLNPGRMREGL